MASFRPFPPQTSFRPPPPPSNQNPLHPPPPPPSQASYQSNPYSQHHGFGRGGGSQPSAPSSSYPPPNYNQIHPNSNHHHRYNPSSRHFGQSRNQQHHPQQQQQYPFQPPSLLPQSSYSLPGPPPPPPQSSINSQPPPPPPSLYYPSSSQYSQFNRPPSPPPPPPPSSPPSLPPPPPPPISSSVPPSHQASITNAKETAVGGHGHKKPVLPPKQEKGSVGKPDRIHNGPSLAVSRVETEEERKLRKKREYEKQRQEEKRQQQLKESQSNVMHKTQLLSAGVKGHGSMAGSRMAERKTTLLGGERIDNRLKKPTTFLCKLKFRNELPDPTAQPKLLSLNTNKDQYTKYTITSLEKMHKPKLFVEPDLGIPLDLLDISVYNTPQIRPPLAPEDEELLRDGEFATPVKQDGIRRKDRPTDKGVSWLVKTQYISPLSMEAAKLSITEKQAKELRETREGRNLFLENLNNREKQIQAIEESFKASKLRPVHQTNPSLEPVEILPLLPDFDRYDDRFVMAAFDGDPTADSEIYSKLDRSVRDEQESQAIMKSFVVSGSDPAKPEKFLAYMVPAPDELSKDMYDEHEDILYSWVREYHWDVRGDDADDPTTYLVSFDEEAARYLPLPTRLVLQKKRAKEGRSSDEVEHFPVPSSVTVRQGSAVAAVELKDSGASNGYYANSKVDILSSKRVRSDIEDGLEPPHKAQRVQDIDHFSEAEDMSD